MDIMLRAREVVAARSWSTSPNIVIRMEEAAKLRDDRGSLPHLQIIGRSTPIGLSPPGSESFRHNAR